MRSQNKTLANHTITTKIIHSTRHISVTIAKRKLSLFYFSLYLGNPTLLLSISMSALTSISPFKLCLDTYKEI